MTKPTVIHFDIYHNQLEVSFDSKCKRLNAKLFYPGNTKNNCRIIAIQPDDKLTVYFSDGQTAKLSWHTVCNLIEEQ